MSIIETIRTEVERLYSVYKAKYNRNRDNYNLGIMDGLYLAKQAINNTLQEKSEKPINPVCEGLEKEIERYKTDMEYLLAQEYGKGFETNARHFYELGRSEKPNNHLEHPVDFPTTDEEMKAFLATHPKVEVPERYKKPDWVFEQPVCEGFDRELSKFSNDVDAEHPFPICVDEYKDFARHFYELGRQSKPKVCEGLEEAALEYETDNTIQTYDGGGLSPMAVVGLAEAFEAGAKWQAEQLLKSSPLPEDTILFNKGVEEGKRLMMEDAVEGTYNNSDWGTPCIDLPSPLELERFDKVRIIIVKED